MNKHNILSLFFLLTVAITAKAQSRLDTFLKSNEYNLMLTTEPFGSSLGGILNISHPFLNSKHFEATLGVAFQYSRTLKTKFERNMSSDTRTTDCSFLVTQDWQYFPFRKKHLVLEAGLYAGFTSSVSRGSLSLPQYDIYEEYHNQHNYFNYGSMQSLSWVFKSRFKVGFFSMISLKGYLDSGRTRPAEVDSRFFIGLKLGYKFLKD